MKSFVWDQNFVTGLTEIDEQHHVLVDLINRFGDLLGSSAEHDFQEIHSVIKELDRYTQYHFREEEELMERVDVDPRHRSVQYQAHAEFCEEVQRIKGVISGELSEKAEHLLKFLIHWLAYHILGTDQFMARQVQAILAGEAPEAAYASQAQISDAALEPMLRALNGLFHQVSRHNRELVELNCSLETKVAERTQELSVANQRLEHLALTDALTNLPNRRHALQSLDLEWAESSKTGRPLTVMMIDADGFKKINDSHGHDAGDAVLRALASQLRDSVRTDDLVCRLGGDEFLILCPGTSLAGALQFAESLRLGVAELRAPAGAGEWRGSISVGVAERQPSMVAHEDLLKAADNAVYLAKQRGRNCVASCETHLLPA